MSEIATRKLLKNKKAISEHAQKPKVFGKNVWYLGLVSLFTDVSSEMIFPILPVFLTTVLKANMAVVGVIEGIAESASSILKLFSGWLSDKLKKKKLLIFSGYSLSTITKPLFAISSTWTQVLMWRVADRVGKGIRTSPKDALIAESVPKKERGRAFGINRMMDRLGAIIGTLFASAILLVFAGRFRLVFWLSFIPAFIAVLVIIFFVREKKQKKPEIKSEKKFSLNLRQFKPELRKFILITALFNLANFSYAFFILRAENIGITLALLPMVYLVYNLFYAGLSIPAGNISDRIGRKTVLSFGFFLFGLTSLGFAFFANSITVWLLFAFYGVFMAISDGVSRAYISDIVNAGKRGTAIGVYNSMVGIMFLPANLIGGFLWNSINVYAPFIYAAVVSIIASVLLLVLVKR